MTKHSINQTIDKYIAYQSSEHGVFTVTLSTYLDNSKMGTSDTMRNFWDYHFIHRVKRHLPYQAKEKIDYDWVVECSPGYHYHYHGVLAVHKDYKRRVWNGGLNKRLSRDIGSFKSRGRYRPFSVNSFLIEPPENIAAWWQYATKQSRYAPKYERTTSDNNKHDYPYQIH